MKKINAFLMTVLTVILFFSGCMSGESNPSSGITGKKEVFISRVRCSLIDDPISAEEMESISGVSPYDVIWLAQIDDRYYGVGYFCSLEVLEQRITGRIKLYEYTFTTSCPHVAFLIFDEKTNEVLRLTRENIEDFITEDQAKILFDTAKNADWKNKEPETTANNNAAETT